MRSEAISMLSKEDCIKGLTTYAEIVLHNTEAVAKFNQVLKSIYDFSNEDIFAEYQLALCFIIRNAGLIQQLQELGFPFSFASDNEHQAAPAESVTASTEVNEFAKALMEDEAPLVFESQQLSSSHKAFVRFFTASLLALKNDKNNQEGLVQSVVAIRKKLGEPIFNTLHYVWLLTWQGQRLLLKLEPTVTADILTLLNTYSADTNSMRNLIALLNSGKSAQFLMSLDREWIQQPDGFQILILLTENEAEKIDFNLLPHENISAQLFAYAGLDVATLDESECFLKQTLIDLVAKGDLSKSELMDRLTLIEKVYPGEVLAKIALYFIEHIRESLSDERGEGLPEEASGFISRALDYLVPMVNKHEFLISLLEQLKGYQSDLFFRCFYQLHMGFPELAVEWFIENRVEINERFEPFKSFIAKGLNEWETETETYIDPLGTLGEFENKYKTYQEEFIQEIKSPFDGEIVLSPAQDKDISKEEFALFHAMHKRRQGKDDLIDLFNLINLPGFVQEVEKHEKLLGIIAVFSFWYSKATHIKFSYTLPTCLIKLYESPYKKINPEELWSFQNGIEELLNRAWAHLGFRSESAGPCDAKCDAYVFDPRYTHGLDDEGIVIGLRHLQEQYKSLFVSETEPEDLDKTRGVYFHLLSQDPVNLVDSSGFESELQSFATRVDSVVKATSFNVQELTIIYFSILKLTDDYFVASFIYKSTAGKWHVKICDPAIARTNDEAGDVATTFDRLSALFQLVLPGAVVNLAAHGQTANSRDYGYLALETIRRVLAAEEQLNERLISRDGRDRLNSSVADKALQPRISEEEDAIQMGCDEWLLQQPVSRVRDTWYGVFESVVPNWYRAIIKLRSSEKSLSNQAVIRAIQERCELKFEGGEALFDDEQFERRAQIIKEWDKTLQKNLELKALTSSQTEAVELIGSIESLVLAYSSVIPVDQHTKFILAAVYEEQLLAEFKEILFSDFTADEVAKFLINAPELPNDCITYQVLVDYCYVTPGDLAQQVVHEQLGIIMPKIKNSFSMKYAEIICDLNQEKIDKLLDLKEFEEFIDFFALINSAKLTELESSIVSYRYESSAEFREFFYGELLESYVEVLTELSKTNSLILCEDDELMRLAQQEEFDYSGFRLRLGQVYGLGLHQHFALKLSDKMIDIYRKSLLLKINLRKICNSLDRVEAYFPGVSERFKTNFHNSPFMLLKGELENKLTFLDKVNMTQIREDDFLQRVGEVKSLIWESVSSLLKVYTKGDVRLGCVSNGLRSLLQQIFNLSTLPFLSKTEALDLDEKILSHMDEKVWFSLVLPPTTDELVLIPLKKDPFRLNVNLSQGDYYYMLSYWYTHSKHPELEEKIITPLIECVRDPELFSGESLGEIVRSYYQNSISDPVLSQIFHCIATSDFYKANTDGVGCKYSTIRKFLNVCMGLEKKPAFSDALTDEQYQILPGLVSLAQRKLLFFSSLPEVITKLDAMCSRWTSIRSGAKTDFFLNLLEVETLEKFVTDNSTDVSAKNISQLTSLERLFVLLGLEVKKARSSAEGLGLSSEIAGLNGGAAEWSFGAGAEAEEVSFSFA